MVLGSQVLRALDCQEGVYPEVPRAGDPFPLAWSCGYDTGPCALLTCIKKWCLGAKQRLGCSDLIKNQGRR